MDVAKIVSKLGLIVYPGECVQCLSCRSIGPVDRWTEAPDWYVADIGEEGVRCPDCDRITDLVDVTDSHPFVVLR